eukprot:11168.XXX_30192_29481_1 [CDS] Oithona nana genome sequencing.
MELIHDFLTHGEAEIIKQIAEPTFTTQVHHDQKPLTQAALVYPDNEIVKKVYQRVEDATMLDMKQSDPLQVTAYQPGGLYLPHFDFNAGSLNPGLYNEQTGHRIATFLLYLSDVEKNAGGETYFPALDLKITPVKGTAIFWFNLKSDGGPQMKSMHVGTPIFHNRKWVASFWIRSGGQEFRHPCDLRQHPMGQTVQTSK